MRAYNDLPETPSRDRLLIGVSEYVVAEGDETLVAYGLGASVAVVLHDPSVGVGALTHTLLPRRGDRSDGKPGKFVDSVVPAALREMIAAGAGYGSIVAYIVGGADIFDLQNLAKGVGERNARVAREELESLDVPVVATDVGGSRGRTVEFDLESGEVVVRTADGDREQL